MQYKYVINSVAFKLQEKNRILKLYEGENIEKDERKFVKQNERLEIILDYILGK